MLHYIMHTLNINCHFYTNSIYGRESKILTKNFPFNQQFNKKSKAKKNQNNLCLAIVNWWIWSRFYLMIFRLEFFMAERAGCAMGLISPLPASRKL